METSVHHELVTPSGTLYFNGFDVDPVAGYGKPYFRLEEVEGLDGAQLRTPTEERPQRDGLIAFPFLEGGRFPALRGLIIPRTLAERRQMEDNLRGYFRSMRNANGILRWRPTAGQMRWQLPFIGDGLIFDAQRTAGTDGDGLAADGSAGIWRGTINLLTNGGFETNATGWNVNNATITRVTSKAKFGAACGQVARTAGTDYHAEFGTAISGSTAGRVFTSSAWVFGEGTAVGKNLRLILREEGGASGFADTNADFTIVAGWQRVTVTRTIVQDDRTTVRFYLWRNSGAGAGELFSVDGAQTEERPSATPYVHTDGSTATRTNANPQGDSSPAGGPGQPGSVYGPLRPSKGWAHFVVRPRWASTDPAPWDGSASGLTYLWHWYANATNKLELYYDHTTDKFKLLRVGSGTVDVVDQAAAFAAGGTVVVTVKWSVSELAISVNGAAFTTVSSTTGGVNLANAPYYIGKSAQNAGWLHGELLWCAFGMGGMTTADLASLNGLGADDAGGLTKLMRGSEFLSEDTQPSLVWQGKTADYLVVQERRCAVRAFEPLQIKGAVHKEFRLGMVAPEPLIASEAEYSVTDSASPFATTIANTIDADTTGLDATWPKIRITAGAAGLTNVDVRNDTTLAKVRLLALGLTNGQWVEVDMRQETVVKSDGTDLSGKVDVPNSEFWSAAPGSTIASLQAITGDVTSLLTKFRLAFAG